MKESGEMIEAIVNAGSYVEVFNDLDSWKDEYKALVKLIHPDVCRDSRSTEALFKLNKFKEQLESGISFSDEACTINYTLNTCIVTGEEKVIERNRANYLKLVSLKDEASKHFQKYLPESMDVISREKLRLTFSHRAIPISSIKELDQKHVNWIMSRLFEFTCWLNQSGFCHAGITPDSIFVIPENHGIVCTSFYHLMPLDQRLKTISGKYATFYPSTVMSDKLASSNIDIALSKKIAIWLLGDESGNGAKLRGKVIDECLDFLQQVDYDPLETYNTYRRILKTHFNTKEFHQLKL